MKYYKKDTGKIACLGDKATPAEGYEECDRWGNLLKDKKQTDAKKTSDKDK